MNDQAPAKVSELAAEVTDYDPGLGTYSFSNLNDVVKFAGVMSQAGEMLPDHLRHKPALCLAVTMRAQQWGFDPFALAMETYQAKQGGPIGYQAKVFTAALRQCAKIDLRFRYEGEVTMLDKPVKSARGNQIAARTATGNRKCIAYLPDDDREYATPPLDGITIKNSPQWHNDPDQQLAYYAARGWARRYRSDVIMGAYSTDEVETMEPMRDVTPKSGFAARKAAVEDVSKAETDVEPAIDGEVQEVPMDPHELGYEAYYSGHDEDAHEFEGEAAARWRSGWNKASAENVTPVENAADVEGAS